MSNAETVAGSGLRCSVELSANITFSTLTALEEVSVETIAHTETDFSFNGTNAFDVIVGESYYCTLLRRESYMAHDQSTHATL